MTDQQLRSTRKVFATREGLPGSLTASGFRIPIASQHHIQVPFVALPAERALGCHILINNPATGFSCIAVILDVGPHFTDDDAYVFSAHQPRAIAAHILRRTTNEAGIDLGETVWNRLGMKDNGEVEWRFLVDSYLENLVSSK